MGSIGVATYVMVDEQSDEVKKIKNDALLECSIIPYHIQGKIT
jgi:hypothetical protein